MATSATLTATGRNGGSLTFTARLSGTPKRTGKSVTFKIAWSTSGSGYYGYATINGTKVMEGKGTQNSWPDLNKSGTYIVSVETTGTTVKVPLYVYYYQQYSGAWLAGRASGELSITVPPANVTVNFNPNGGRVSPTSKVVTYNDKYGTLPTPTRTGYRFTGWYTAASGGTKVLATSTVLQTAAHTLYAQWDMAVKLRVLHNGTLKLAKGIYVVENGKVRQATSLYVVQNGSVKQGV